MAIYIYICTYRTATDLKAVCYSYIYSYHEQFCVMHRKGCNAYASKIIIPVATHTIQ